MIYGLLLCWCYFDCVVRFCNASFTAQLPAWLRSSVNNYSNFGLAMRDMAAFFRNAEKSVTATQYNTFIVHVDLIHSAVCESQFLSNSVKRWLVFLSLSMFMLSSVWAHKLCTLSESCVLTAWTTSRCRQFTGLSSSPSWHMPQVPPISRDLKRSSAIVIVMVSCQPTSQHLWLCENVDEKLFNAITSDCNHVLHYLLPSQSQGSQHYDLQQRPHNFALPSRTGHLTDRNYIQRMLYLNSY